MAKKQLRWTRRPALLLFAAHSDSKSQLDGEFGGVACGANSKAEYSDSNRGITLSFTREKKSVTSISEKCEACPLFAFLAWIL